MTQKHKKLQIRRMQAQTDHEQLPQPLGAPRPLLAAAAIFFCSDSRGLREGGGPRG